MSHAASYLSRANEEAKRNGAEYIGSVINLNVSLNNTDNCVPLNDVRQAIIDNPLVPSHWAPEPLNPLSIYLKLTQELGRKALTTFQETGVEINEEEFGGYIVKRLHLQKAEDVPTAHRVFFTRKVASSVADNHGATRTVEDIEIEHSIIVTLRRVWGTVDTDLSGGSVFQIEVDYDDCPLHLQRNFQPFILSAQALFEKRQNGIYEASQIRELFLNVIHNHIGADTLNKGLYFVYRDKIDSVSALSESLNGLDSGINVINLPIPKYQDPNSLGNQAFKQVSQAVGSSILNDASALLSELKSFEDADTKTRGGTWDSRADMLRELRKKVELYRNKELLVGDSLDDVLKKCGHILINNL
jgi:hypothetical protein